MNSRPESSMNLEDLDEGKNHIVEQRLQTYNSYNNSHDKKRKATEEYQEAYQKKFSSAKKLQGKNLFNSFSRDRKYSAE